jgi:hypothetical protein
MCKMVFWILKLWCWIELFNRCEDWGSLNWLSIAKKTSHKTTDISSNLNFSPKHIFQGSKLCWILLQAFHYSQLCAICRVRRFIKMLHLSAKNPCKCTGRKKDNCCAIGAAFLGRTRRWLIRTAEESADSIWPRGEMALFLVTFSDGNCVSWKVTLKSAVKSHFEKQCTQGHTKANTQVYVQVRTLGAALLSTNKKRQQTAQVKHWRADASVNFARR